MNPASFHHNSARLACVKHAASVRPEPGSNSSVQSFKLSELHCLFPCVSFFLCRFQGPRRSALAVSLRIIQLSAPLVKHFFHGIFHFFCVRQGLFRWIPQYVVVEPRAFSPRLWSGRLKFPCFSPPAPGKKPIKPSSAAGFSLFFSAGGSQAPGNML